MENHSNCTTFNSTDNNNDSTNLIKQDAMDNSDCRSDIATIKKKKMGIVYINNIPKHMNVTRMREYFSSYGHINRIYLQPIISLIEKKNVKSKSYIPRHFSEGWIEFCSKRVARKLAEMLNNKQISQSKKSQFYDCLWSIKYLPHFKWHHLTERMRYEQTVLKQRGCMERSQAQRETTFFQNNLDKSERHRRQSNCTLAKNN